MSIHFTIIIMPLRFQKVNDIPIDYDGCMGVPITFMNKYNPDQFEIVAV